MVSHVTFTPKISELDVHSGYTRGGIGPQKAD